MNMFLGTVWSPVGSCPFKKWWRCSQYLWRKNWSVGTAWVLGVSFMAEKAEKWLTGYFLMKLWMYENHIWEFLGYQRFFLAWDEDLHRPHERRSHKKKPLVQSALIYHAGWTLTLSLICQSNQWSQANLKVITKGGTTRCSTKSHTISR